MFLTSPNLCLLIMKLKKKIPTWGVHSGLPFVKPNILSVSLKARCSQRVPRTPDTICSAWSKTHFLSSLSHTLLHLTRDMSDWRLTLYLTSTDTVPIRFCLLLMRIFFFFISNWWNWFLTCMQDFAFIDIHLAFWSQPVFLSLIQSLSTLTFPCSL